MQRRFVHRYGTPRKRIVLTLCVVLLALSALACNLLGGTGSAATPTPQTNALWGKWQNDETQGIIEITADNYIVYDIPAPGHKLLLEYTVQNGNTIQLDLEGSRPFTFAVEGDTLTVTQSDGDVLTYTRQAAP